MAFVRRRKESLATKKEVVIAALFPNLNGENPNEDSRPNAWEEQTLFSILFSRALVTDNSLK